MKRFLQSILQEIMKKITLGTSDACSMRRSSHRPSDPAEGQGERVNQIHLGLILYHSDPSDVSYFTKKVQVKSIYFQISVCTIFGVLSADVR